MPNLSCRQLVGDPGWPPRLGQITSAVAADPKLQAIAQCHGQPLGLWSTRAPTFFSTAGGAVLTNRSSAAGYDTARESWVVDHGVSEDSELRYYVTELGQPLHSFPGTPYPGLQLQLAVSAARELLAATLAVSRATGHAGMWATP